MNTNMKTDIQKQKMIVNEIIIEGKKYHDVLIFTEVETTVVETTDVSKDSYKTFVPVPGKLKTRLIIKKLKGYGDYK